MTIQFEKQPEMMETYHNIIVNKLDKRVVKIACKKLQGSCEHYLQQKLVLREKAKSTKVRIVYDASEKFDERSLSLNDCIDIAPPLQRRISDVLLRSQMRPILLLGDTK